MQRTGFRRYPTRHTAALLILIGARCDGLGLTPDGADSMVLWCFSALYHERRYTMNGRGGCF